MAAPLAGKVALVAGATRGAGRGIAVQLGAAGATVYVHRPHHARAAIGDGPAGDDRGDRRARRRGRRARDRRPGRPPRARRGARRSSSASTASRARSTSSSTTSGARPTMEWNKTVWESTLDVGLRTLRLAVDTHAITSHFALPLLIRDARRPRGRGHRRHRRVQRHQLPRVVLLRPRQGRGEPHGVRARARAGAARRRRPCRSRRVGCGPRRCSTPTRSPRRTGATPTKFQPHFAISETPAFVGRAVAALAADPDVARWNGQSLSSGQLAQVYGFTDLDGSQPDAWRYLVEVQDAGQARRRQRVSIVADVGGRAARDLAATSDRSDR